MILVSGCGASIKKRSMAAVEFDLGYARQVISSEAEAIRSVGRIVDESFGKAVEMIFNCKGSCIVSGIGKAGIIGQKISATLASTGTPSHFLHPAEAVHGDLGLMVKLDTEKLAEYELEAVCDIGALTYDGYVVSGSDTIRIVPE